MSIVFDDIVPGSYQIMEEKLKLSCLFLFSGLLLFAGLFIFATFLNHYIFIIQTFIELQLFTFIDGVKYGT